MCAAGSDAHAERLFDGAVREVPRGAGVADEPDGPVRQLALRRWRVRAFLRLPRWRDEPVCAGALRRHGARRAGSHAGGGLPPQRRSLRPGDRVGAPAEGPDARQAVLRLFRARCDARPASRARGMVGEIQGGLRPGLGRAARGDIRASEAAGRDRCRCRSDRAARADSRVGGHAGCPQARARPSDGGLRGLSRAHRPPRGAADRCPRRHGGAGRHARVRDHRRQRRIRRGLAQGQLQRAPDAERRRRARDRRIHEPSESTSSARRRRTTTTPSAGHTR